MTNLGEHNVSSDFKCSDICESVTLGDELMPDEIKSTVHAAADYCNIHEGEKRSVATQNICGGCSSAALLDDRWLFYRRGLSFVKHTSEREQTCYQLPGANGPMRGVILSTSEAQITCVKRVSAAVPGSATAGIIPANFWCASSSTVKCYE